jgi:hypothetical protein
MRVIRFLVLATAAASGVLLAPGSAFAHGMNAKVTVADDVRVEAYFDGDFPAEFAEVTVTDAGGKEVFVGKADERGVCTVPRPAPGEYTLTAKCAGHTATVRFRIEGDPGAGPAAYTGWRLNKFLGLAIGLILIFGISAASWLIRRRGRS